MNYEDVLFLTGFFLVIFFFVGSKHKPDSLSGWIVFAVLSFTLTPFVSVPLTWYTCKKMNESDGKKSYPDVTDMKWK